MGIWVRSQDKQVLIKSKSFWLVPPKRTSNPTDNFVINGDSGVDNQGFVLGKYPTEEEAMKVLDMVENHIQLLAYPFPNSEPSVVFQMPPAGFSQTEGE